MPWFLQVAIEHGLMILGWFENLPKEEVPPEHLWADTEGLEEWWEDVDRKRKAKYGGGDEPDDEDMTDNDIAREFKRAVG